MARRATGATQGSLVTGSAGVSGWCLAGQHPECLYGPCTCQRCPEEVHHSRSHQRAVVEYGQTSRWAGDDADDAVPSADDGDGLPAAA